MQQIIINVVATPLCPRRRRCPHSRSLSRCHLHLPNSRPLQTTPYLPSSLLLSLTLSFTLAIYAISIKAHWLQLHTHTDTVTHRHTHTAMHMRFYIVSLDISHLNCLSCWKLFTAFCTRLEINFIKFMFSFSQLFRELTTIILLAVSLNCALNVP